MISSIAGISQYSIESDLAARFQCTLSYRQIALHYKISKHLLNVLFRRYLFYRHFFRILNAKISD